MRTTPLPLHHIVVSIDSAKWRFYQLLNGFVEHLQTTFTIHKTIAIHITDVRYIELINVLNKAYFVENISALACPADCQVDALGHFLPTVLSCTQF